MDSKSVITTIILTVIILKLNFATANKTESFNSSFTEERIITNIEDVENGVPIDFNYNETSSSSSPGALSSVPGCPRSDEGYPWVYHGSPPRCYLAGQRGPCDVDRSIFITDGSPFGFCNCNCFEGVRRSNKIDYQFCKISDSGETDTEFTFMAALGKCFKIYDQGPCDEDERIVKVVKNTSGGIIVKAMCQRNPLSQILLVSTKNPYESDTDISGVGLIIPHSEEECKYTGRKYSKLLKKCVNKFIIKF
ncbi:unnamed protein product [Orchesella dallaii]|uniref:DUF4789 domain-containing protein n=1 Tax=Orchesella dallaii TaxID=48710 RepID=A0ABP1QD58_9HEXA